jgi:formate hydrogenlyase transcriptional activator
MTEERGNALCPPLPPSPKTGWLAENGPKALEQLFRTIVYNPAAPILITDNDRNYREASVGAEKLLLPRAKIIGRGLDDFAAPAVKRVISERWRTFLKEGEQSGTLELLGQDREVEYTAKSNVLPVRHLLVLRDKTKPAAPEKDASLSNIPSWVQDYALFLLDPDGKIAAWYAGAERIHGCGADERRSAVTFRFSIPAVIPARILHRQRRRNS